MTCRYTRARTHTSEPRCIYLLARLGASLVKTIILSTTSTTINVQ